MPAPKEPDTSQIPKHIPAWACKRWGHPNHVWTDCAQCQQVYRVHVELENDPKHRGVLHWFAEELNEATACGSPSEATTEHLGGPRVPTEVIIDGVLRVEPQVTCPICLEIAKDNGHEVDIPYHEEPYTHG